jgi:hypothetical protein
VVEIQGLESLFAAMEKDSPDRPRLMDRLALSYVDLARVAAKDRDASPAKSEDARKADRVWRACEQAAAKFYKRIAQEHPGYCKQKADEQKGPACAAEPFYYAGLAFEALKDLDMARREYLSAVELGPSAFAGYAYLAFGELFLQERGLPHVDLAQQAFEEVMKAGSPESPLHGYALLRMGQIRLQLDDAAGARSFFDKVRALVATNPTAAIPARLLPPE